VASTPAPTLRRLKILVCAQNEWYTQPIPCQAGGGVDSVITLGGSVFLSVGTRGTPDLDAFLDRTVDEVAAQIQRFLDRHPDVSDKTPAVVIMDIEKPHPADFHLHPTSVQRRLSRAFGIRAAAARCKFPKAKLGFYGTLIPDARGRAADEKYLARKRALVKAGERGMFDLVDCLFPVVYPRFGPTDRPWSTYEPYTRLAVTGSRELERSDGSSLAVIPLLTYSVANKNSQHNKQLLLDLPVRKPLEATLGVQLDVLLDERVRTAVFWVGENSDLITRLPNPNGRTVTQHVCT
jgi:hypothetical protein